MERNEALTKNAQALRKNATKEERLLWSHFLCRYPLRFRRQYVIGNYIVDFYCHRAKLAIELDGSQHYEAKMPIMMNKEPNFSIKWEFVFCDLPIRK